MHESDFLPQTSAITASDVHITFSNQADLHDDDLRQFYLPGMPKGRKQNKGSHRKGIAFIALLRPIDVSSACIAATRFSRLNAPGKGC
jgi:hypothetical protein